MKPPTDSVPDRVVSAGIALAVVGVAAQTAIHLFNGWALDYRWGALNAAEDESVFGWASTAATFGAAVGVMLTAATQRSRLAASLILAAIIAFLSLDDFIGVHERVGDLRDSLGLWEKADRLVWPAIFLPLLAATFVLALRLSRDGPTRAGRLVRAGLALLAVAVALEIGSQGLYQFGWDNKDLPLVIEVVAEEGAELAGWILVATGFFTTACARLIAIGSPLDASATPPRVERGTEGRRTQ